MADARMALDWDVVNWSKALKLWERHLPHGELRVLTVGDRKGGLAWWFSQKGHRVVCTDIELEDEVIQGKLSGHDKVVSQMADLLSLEFPDSHFDVVAFKSVLGAMRTEERQRQAMSEIKRVLKPGGLLLLAENTEASAMHRFFRKKFISWGDSWKYLHPKNDASLFEGFEEKQSSSHGFFGAFGRNEAQRRLAGRVDALFSPLTPGTWRYIHYGVWQKKG